VKLLPVKDAEKLLRKYKIPFSESILYIPGKSHKNKIKTPAVVKIDSPDVVHKSDVGGVVCGVDSISALKKACAEITSNVKRKYPDAKINGFQIQTTEKGHELIIGMKKDPQFGPVLLFGLGGIFVELMKDYALRICPVDKKEALRMIEDTKAHKLMQGLRGQKPSNFEAVVDIIIKLSKMVMKEKNIEQIDFNPVIVNENVAKVVDARILVK